MEQELTKFDQQYFTREFQVFPILSIIELSYLDSAFFTSHDILWARIKGKYNFIKYLNTLLNEIEHNEQPEQRKISTKSLEWTASKTSLVELIYALQASNAINNGNEDIKAIAQAFEQLFDLTLDNIYKTYSEIKIRKKNRSTFLNKLITRFQDKINSENEFIVVTLQSLPNKNVVRIMTQLPQKNSKIQNLVENTTLNTFKKIFRNYVKMVN